MDIHCPSTIFKGLFFPFKLSWHSRWKSVGHRCMFICLFFWTLNSVPLFCMSYLHQYQSWPQLLCGKFWLEEWILQLCSSSRFLWLFFIPLSFKLHLNVIFKISLSIRIRKGSWNFYRNCAEFVDQFGEYCDF